MQMEKSQVVSIIIPVYNVESYLTRCIESIVNQTYTTLQIILVDDGSTDKSGSICDNYARLDQRIEVIHKKNGGLSEARNEGLIHAKGDYIIFVDSDDYVSQEYVRYLYKLLMDEEADIATCRHIETDKKYIFKNVNIQEYKVYNREEAFEKLCYQIDVTTSAWGKIYKAFLFEEVRFPKGKLYEDESTFYKILNRSSKIVCGYQVHYLYYYRKSGIVRSKFNIKKMDYFYQSWEFAEFIKKNYCQLYEGAISKVVWSSLHLWVQIKSKKSFPREYKKLKDTICKYRLSILKNKRVRKKNKLVLLGTYCGHWFLSLLYSLTKL